jgi:hypothetical protein
MSSDDPLDPFEVADPVELPRWVHTGLTQQIVFGVGALDRLSDGLKSVGLRRVLLVTTEGRAGSDEGAG